MGPYEQVLDHILQFGKRRPNRTGVDTLGIFGVNLTYDLTHGFPAITTKKLAFNSVKAELLGFLAAFDNARAFRNLGTSIWDANANETPAWVKNPARRGEDDLGRIYGVQWRGWQDTRVTETGEAESYVMEKFGYKPVLETEFSTVWQREIDQIAQVIHSLRTNPYDRRMIVSAWNPSDVDQCALPPCHMIMQFNADPEEGTLDLLMMQRSADWFLGVPFNIASYALLLSMIAHVTGYRPRALMMTFGDAHLYENHIEQAREQISRTPKPLPTLWLNPEVKEIDDFTVNSIGLLGYDPHPAISAPMAA